MHIRTPIGPLLALSTVLIAGCDDSRANAPYASGYGQASSAGSASLAGGGSVVAGSGGAQAGSGPSAGAANVILANGSAFQAYLTDASGHALYMFANDVPGTSTSTCTAACLDKWPVFDAKEINVSTGLTASDFGRFQRTDGAWQTTFKGHPLYRFAMDATVAGVNGDGMAGRWYVARDYIAFVAAKADLTPQGAAAPAPYMTNRAGRTVYVFMSDTKGVASTPPVSACVDKCLDAWPTWNAPATLASMTLPSSMKAADFSQVERLVAGAPVKQLTYRGWPLYFHTPDDAPGMTSGHLSGAWRAIDPTTFGGTAAAATP